jgi:phosphocarrier protein
MITREVTIINPSGMHARPAANFVAAAAKFSSDIRIRNLDPHGSAVNAKSMLMLLTLALAKGKRAELTADGVDEAQAMETLVKLIESGCGETV